MNKMFPEPELIGLEAEASFEATAKEFVWFTRQLQEDFPRISNSDNVTERCFNADVTTNAEVYYLKSPNGSLKFINTRVEIDGEKVSGFIFESEMFKYLPGIQEDELECFTWFVAADASEARWYPFSDNDDTEWKDPVELDDHVLKPMLDQLKLWREAGVLDSDSYVKVRAKAFMAAEKIISIYTETGILNLPESSLGILGVIIKNITEKKQIAVEETTEQRAELEAAQRRYEEAKEREDQVDAGLMSAQSWLASDIILEDLTEANRVIG
jgi:hypothetical protein